MDAMLNQILHQGVVSPEDLGVILNGWERFYKDVLSLDVDLSKVGNIEPSGHHRFNQLVVVSHDITEDEIFSRNTTLSARVTARFLVLF